MKKSTVFFGALTLSVVLVSCAKVPVTGRRQLSLVSDETINKSAVTAYQDFLKEPKTKVIANTADAERVRTVGKKIATVIDAYLKEKYPNAAQNYQWEFNLVESKEINIEVS
jgi:hypothetical protein